MYQDWVAPPFSVEQLTEFCVEFFDSRKIPTSLEKSAKGKTIIRAEIRAIRKEIRILIDKEESRLRLTFPVDATSTSATLRLLNIFLTGWFIKTGTERDEFLDTLEQQFWASIDQRLAEYKLAGRDSFQNT